MTHIHPNILNARETRYQLQPKGKTVISLSLNIPGYPKTNDCILWVFQHILDDLIRWFQANGLSISKDQCKCHTDEAGHVAWLTGDEPANTIKTIAEQFEMQHPIGRLVDVDVTAADGERQSSGRKKQCLLCEQPAHACIRAERHSVESVRNQCDEMLTHFQTCTLQSRYKSQLIEAASHALLAEAALNPKPGLVTPHSNGAHRDMTFAHFLKSTASLISGFESMIETVISSDIPIEKALPHLRAIGLGMETEMYRATDGINTHKGAIFLMGLAVWAAAVSLKTHQRIILEDLQRTIQTMCHNLTRELALPQATKTHGQLVFEKYGLTGARGEAESGFGTLFDRVLPFAQSPDAQGLNERELQLALLVVIMAHNQDTTIAWRKGMDTLQQVQIQAQAIQAQGFWTEKSWQMYEALGEFCLIHQISGGGSADLLAVSIFFLGLTYRF